MHVKTFGMVYWTGRKRMVIVFVILTVYPYHSFSEWNTANHSLEYYNGWLAASEIILFKNPISSLNIEKLGYLLPK